MTFVVTKKDMNLFAFLLKMNNSKKIGWKETTAYFTGEARKALPKGRVRFYYNDQPAEYNEYKIRYYVDDKEMFGWYSFYPAPDPEVNEISDISIRIRYRTKRPWDFEFVFDHQFDDRL